MQFTDSDEGVRVLSVPALSAPLYDRKRKEQIMWRKKASSIVVVVVAYT